MEENAKKLHSIASAFFIAHMEENAKKLHSIASAFFIHPQISIFSVFETPSFSPYRLQIKISTSLFYLFTLAINLWHRKFITADVTAVFVNNKMVFSDQNKILIKTLKYTQNTQLHA